MAFNDLLYRERQVGPYAVTAGCVKVLVDEGIYR